MADTERINIRTAYEAHNSGLKPGDRVHIVTERGHACDDAVYRGTKIAIGAGANENIVRIDIDGEPVDPPLGWHEIMELWPVGQRAAGSERINIQCVEDLVLTGLEVGEKVHVVVTGNHLLEGAVYEGPYHNEDDIVVGARISFEGEAIEPPLEWGDIIEFWPVGRPTG